MKSDATLLFMHLTKTAGGSVKSILQESLGDKAFFYNAGSPVEDIVSKGKKVIFGHYAFGLHEDLDIPENYACFLRNPLNRTISHYYHLYNNDKGPVGNKIRESADNINDYFAGSIHWEFSNFMCKVIGGYRRDSELKVDRSLCRKAIANLNEMDFVGIFEFLELSLSMMFRKLDIPVTDIPQVNIGKYKLGDIRPSTYNEIIRLNRWDFLLYEVATELFWKKFML